MSFVKAESGQAFIRLGMYGPQGSGKTFTALLLGEGLALRTKKRVAMIQTERSADFYSQAIKERAVHPEAFDFDVHHTRSLADALDDVSKFDSKKYGVLILDSVSALWDSAIAAYEGQQTKIGTIPMGAWGQLKRPYKKMIQLLLDLPAHVIFTGRQKNIFETGPKGDLIKTGVGMRAEGETEYEPHISVRMEPTYKADGVAAGVTMIVEKDRSGILHGKTFVNPNFSTFEPLLPYLGDTQAQSEDPDEVIARDGELLANDEAKARDKQEKSIGIFNDLNAKILRSADMNALATVAGEVKKQKRYLNSEHYAALGQVYTNRNKELSAKLAPSEV